MENIKYLLLDNQNKIIFNTIEEDKSNIIDLIIDGYNQLNFQNVQYRTAKFSTDEGILYAYTSDKDLLRSSRSFKFNIQIILDSISNFKDYYQDIENEISRHINILIHILMTLNAHNIQDLFLLLPQEELSQSKNSIVKFVKEKIQADTGKVALLLLRLMKSNLAMKTEFSVFGKLFDDNPILNKKNYNVSSVLLNVIYNFFSDLIDKNIKLKYEECQYEAFFDYEAIQVAFFHMIDNTVKYIKENTVLDIRFEDYINQVDIVFSMESLKIDEDETNKIFLEGFSGKQAKEQGKSGKGIGMSRVKQILELNHGEIRLKSSLLPDTSIYSTNIFTISLKKENYFI